MLPGVPDCSTSRELTVIIRILRLLVITWGQLVNISATSKIDGYVSPDFEVVRSVFTDNFNTRNELGGAVCVYHNGEKVVDLWGGVRNAQTGDLWKRDTMVLVFSLTKGLSAMTLAIANSRGWLDYEARVADYWPEFAQNGKKEITVRQLLSHQAGLHSFHQRVNREIVADPDSMAKIMASEKPAWVPGTRNAYHVLTLGFYEAELLRRVDPKRRTLGQFFQEEIAKPLNLEFFIRLPEDIPNDRLATLKQASILKALISLPRPMALALLNPWSHLFRAYVINPGIGLPFDKDRIYARNIEVPSGGGVGTARAIAKAYGVFASGGRELNLRNETLSALRAPADAPSRGLYDEVLKGDAEYTLGFMKPSRDFLFGHTGAFGTPGAGGSLGYADPEIGLGYGYVTNRIGVGVNPDTRDVALREAIASVVG